MNHYLVSFVLKFSGVSESRFGWGNTEVETEGIQSMDDIEAMQKELEKKYNASSVTIMSWNKFERL